MITNLLILTLIIPIFGLAGTACIDAHEEDRIRSAAIWTSIFAFLLTLAGCFFIGKNVQFSLGILIFDAGKMSLFFMTLVSFVILMSFLIGKREITKCVKTFYAAGLGLEIALFLMFTNEDILIFYALFELCILLTFILLRIFVPIEAKKFFTLQLISSFVMMFGIAYSVHISGLTEIQSLSRYAFALSQERVIFWAFISAFAVQAAIFPLHFCTSEILSEVPASLAVIVSGIFNKISIFGILFVLLPLVPHACASYQMLMVSWCLTAIFCSAAGMIFLRKLKQTAARIDIASSAIMMFGAFTLNTAGAAGTLICAGAFSITVSALFYFVYLVEKYHEDDTIQASSIMHRTPMIAVLAEVPILSIAAAPLLPCFLGEFTILSAYFDAHIIVCCLFGAVLLIFNFFSFMLFQRTFFGEKVNPAETNRFDLFVLGIFTVSALLFGLSSHFVSNFAAAAVDGTPIKEIYKNVSI